MEFNAEGAPLETATSPTSDSLTPTNSSGVTAASAAAEQALRASAADWAKKSAALAGDRLVPQEQPQYDRAQALRLAVGAATPGEDSSVTITRATAFADWINMSNPLEVAPHVPLDYYPTLESRDISAPAETGNETTPESVTPAPEAAPVEPDETAEAPVPVVGVTTQTTGQLVPPPPLPITDPAVAYPATDPTAPVAGPTPPPVV